jgi:hypothetical protein
VAAQKEIFEMAKIFYPDADPTDFDSLSNTLMITCAVKLKALSTTKADVAVIEKSISSIHRNVDRVLKDIISVSTCINAVSNTIATSESQSI